VIHVEFLLIVLAAALYRGSGEQRLAARAAIASGLALAGLRAAPIPEVSSGPPGFVAVEGALLAIAAGLAIASVVSAMRSTRTPISVVASSAAAAGAVGLALSAGRFVAVAPFRALLVAVVALVGAGLLLFARRRLPVGTPRVAHATAPPIGLAAVGAGALLTAAGPRVGAVFIGGMLAAIGGWLVSRSPEKRALPVAPALTLGLLLLAWWLMATIAGPEGLAIGSLPDLPWSPAAERLLAPALLVAAWGMSGLWPLHRQEPATLTAPVAALLIGRVAISAVPDGLDHWRALAVPVILLALWHGVLTRDRAETVAGLAWVGLVTVTPVGQVGAALLLVGGLGLELADRRPAWGNRVGPGVRAVAILLVGTGALFAIQGGLHTEVVYTVAAVAALVAAAGSSRALQASTASAPRATAPSA